MKRISLLLLYTIGLAVLFLSCKTVASDQQTSDTFQGKSLKALIVDGQNNHNHWAKTSLMMKQYLEETDLFTVDIDRVAYCWQGKEMLEKYALDDQPCEDLDESKSDPNFIPDFSKYDVVISNFGWRAAPWPQQTQTALEKFVADGGGLVVVHAANNSFPQWKAYNQMIGLGGWGGRTEKDGPYVYYDDQGNLQRDVSPGRGGSHGPQHEFTIQIRDKTHPITQGMPAQWLHTKDELYDRLRGPAENMQILATAFSAEDKKGTGRHEPMLITLTYEKGRVFHTPMGHADYSMECVGYILSFTRGTEWAATGKVSQTDLPSDFPSSSQSSARKFSLKKSSSKQ